MDFINTHTPIVLALISGLIAIGMYLSSIKRHDYQIKDMTLQFREMSTTTNAKIDNFVDKIVNKVEAVENKLNQNISALSATMHNIQLEQRDTIAKVRNNSDRIAEIKKEYH